MKVATTAESINARWFNGLVTFVGWRRDEQGLHQDLTFKDFDEAWAFMQRVAEIAREMDHHPDWSNSWNQVSIRLISHDVGRVTERDEALAARIDALLPPTS